MSDTRTPVDVAVGVLLQADGRFLLADRPAGKPYAGYWEFPGGKVEPGETVAAALARELREELGLDLGTVMPWVIREFDYPHARVRLHFCRVFDWRGTPHGHEGQAWRFCSIADLPAPLLPATVPVLRWLELPAVYGISAASVIGPDRFFVRLRQRLDEGLQLLLWREATDTDGVGEADFMRARDLVHAAGGRVLVSSRHPASWRECADGVQLTASDLARCSERPEPGLVAASVHTPDELAQAIALGCDFAVAGSVGPTATHPDGPTLGWGGLQDLVSDSAIPVYALGGLNPEDLPRAQALGAHGVALRSALWSTA
jgi:8-oxo-dGTP diphosphatase